MKNNKWKLVGIFVALTFLLGLSTFAVAEGGKCQKKKSVPFSALGEVVEVSPGALTLNLEKANRVLKQDFELGVDADFLVADNVRVKTEGTDQGVFDLEFDDIEPTNIVRVLGKKTDDNKYTIFQIVLMIDD